MKRDYSKKMHSWEKISKSQKRCKICKCLLTLKTSKDHVNMNFYQTVSGEIVDQLECIDKPDLSEFYK